MIEHLTLCKDVDCPHRDSCQRYLQVADSASIFFSNSPRDERNNTCAQMIVWRQAMDGLVVKVKPNQPTLTKPHKGVAHG